LSSRRVPSMISMFGFNPLKNEGGHMSESSGGSANSLVVLRDRFPPVESDLLYAFCFGFFVQKSFCCVLC
jgi:hypothetical protein